MTSDIQNAKIELIKWLTTIEDIALVEKLIDIKKQETEYSWNELSKSEKTSIENGIADADNGKLKPHSEAKKRYEKCL